MEVQAECWTTAVVLKTTEAPSPCEFEPHCFRMISSYTYPTGRTTKRTVVEEFDSNGKLVKRVTTEETLYTDTNNYWWQQPIIGDVPYKNPVYNVNDIKNTS